MPEGCLLFKPLRVLVEPPHSSQREFFSTCSERPSIRNRRVERIRMENKYEPGYKPLDTTRREFVQHSLAAAGSVWASSALPLHAETASAGQKPNLIFIYGEGHRWDCLSIAGHPILETPNHDRIGKEGVRFTN